MRGFVLVFSAVLSVLGAEARADALTPVTFASVGGATDAGVFLADDLGYFRQEGIAPQYQIIDTAPTLTAALATGQIDVAGVSLTAGIFAAVQQGIEMRVVGDKQSIRPGFSATRLMVQKELMKASVAETVRGLKGKTIAVSSKGATAYYLLIRFLEKYGLGSADIRIAEIPYPSMVTAMASHAIDAAVPIEPFLSHMLHDGSGVAVTDFVALAFPPQGMCIVGIVYSEKFRNERPTAEAWMRAYVKGVRIFNDAYGKNDAQDKEQVIASIVKHTHLDPAIIRDTVPSGLDPDQRLNIPAMDDLVKFYLEEKMLRIPIAPSAVLDTSFAEAAVKVLGTYK
jgi:NitT/TauT family transport system substrate-binding protein